MFLGRCLCTLWGIVGQMRTKITIGSCDLQWNPKALVCILIDECWEPCTTFVLWRAVSDKKNAVLFLVRRRFHAYNVLVVHHTEGWLSGRKRRSWKPLWRQRHRGFESHSLRQFQARKRPSDEKPEGLLFCRCAPDVHGLFSYLCQLLHN